jgi:hypothetical protein
VAASVIDSVSIVTSVAAEAESASTLRTGSTGWAAAAAHSSQAAAAMLVTAILIFGSSSSWAGGGAGTMPARSRQGFGAAKPQGKL